MITILALSLSFLLLLGLSILNVKRVINVEREFRALMYHSDILQTFLNSSMLAFVGLATFILFFYSWKLFLILILISFIIENNIIVPFTEKALGLMMDKIIQKIDKKNKK